MNLALLCPRLFGPMGGLEVCVHNVASRLAKLGHRVTVYTFYTPPQGFTPSYVVGHLPRFRFSTLAYPFSKLWLQTWAGSRQHRERHDAWLICGGFPYGALLVDWFIRSGVSGALRCSGDDIQVNHEFDYGVRRRPKEDRMVRVEYPKFSDCVAITETVRQEYLALGIPETQIHMIPNGADIERIAAVPADNSLRTRMGIPDGVPLLLSVGRAHPKKGYHFAPVIMGILEKRGVPAHWLFVGRGCQRLLDTAPKHLASRLHFLEQINFGRDFALPSNELIAVYKAADCFVMPSLMETFGIVLLEAMAAGLPVACFDVPGIRDVFHPSCGRMVSAGDTVALADAVGNLLTEGREGGGACNAWLFRHSWDNVAQEYLALFKTMVE